RHALSHSAPCCSARRQRVSAETSISSDQCTDHPHSPTRTVRNRSSSDLSGAKTAHCPRCWLRSMTLSAPPFQLTATQRSFSAQTAPMLGNALTKLIPYGSGSALLVRHCAQRGEDRIDLFQRHPRLSRREPHIGRKLFLREAANDA